MKDFDQLLDTLHVDHKVMEHMGLQSQVLDEGLVVLKLNKILKFLVQI
jgi:hypothetical protein